MLWKSNADSTLFSPKEPIPNLSLPFSCTPSILFSSFNFRPNSRALGFLHVLIFFLSKFCNAQKLISLCSPKSAQPSGAKNDAVYREDAHAREVEPERASISPDATGTFLGLAGEIDRSRFNRRIFALTPSSQVQGEDT